MPILILFKTMDLSFTYFNVKSITAKQNIEHKLCFSFSKQSRILLIFKTHKFMPFAEVDSTRKVNLTILHKMKIYYKQLQQNKQITPQYFLLLYQSISNTSNCQ